MSECKKFLGVENLTIQDVDDIMNMPFYYEEDDYILVQSFIAVWHFMLWRHNHWKITHYPIGHKNSLVPPTFNLDAARKVHIETIAFYFCRVSVEDFLKNCLLV